MDSRQANAKYIHLRALLKKLQGYHYLAESSFNRAKLIEISVEEDVPSYPVTIDWTPEKVVKYFKKIDFLEIPSDKARLRSRRALARLEESWDFVGFRVEDVMEEELSSVFTAKQRLVPHLIEKIVRQATKYSSALQLKRLQATRRCSKELRLQVNSTDAIKANYEHVLDIATTSNSVKEAVLNYCHNRKSSLTRRIYKIDRLIRTVKYKMWRAKCKQ